LILAGRGLRFPFSLLPKGQLPQLPRVVGMSASIGRPVRVTQTLLQLGRLLMHLDRSGMRRQLPALGQRSSLTSAGRLLMCLGGPTGRLAGFLEHLTSLLNGLVSQVPKALQGLVIGLMLPPMTALPFWTSRSTDLPYTSSMAGAAQPAGPATPAENSPGKVSLALATGTTQA
jgi:hypothetical protein